VLFLPALPLAWPLQVPRDRKLLSRPARLTYLQSRGTISPNTTWRPLFDTVIRFHRNHSLLGHFVPLRLLDLCTIGVLMARFARWVVKDFIVGLLDLQSTGGLPGFGVWASQGTWYVIYILTF